MRGAEVPCSIHEKCSVHDRCVRGNRRRGNISSSRRTSFFHHYSGQLGRHFPTSSGVSERCERRTSEWPCTCVPILGFSKHTWPALWARITKTQTKVLSHSLVRSLVCPYRSLVRLLRSACFACALHSALARSAALTHSLARSLFPRSWDSE